MPRGVRKTKKTGIRKVTVPDLSGLTRSQAQAALSAAGLTYSESTTDTSDTSLTSKIQSQGYSFNSTVLIGTNVSFVYYNYVDPITYGPCEAYGSGSVIGSGNQCFGSFYQTYTDYRYNTRKKIYVGGVWDGSSYSTAGCGTTDSRTITGSSQVDGLCGYTAPITITYGGCEAYGSAISNLGSGSYCDGTYTVNYTDYRYNARRAIYYNGSWDGSSYTTSGCSTADVRSINSSSQVNGSCGYTPPAPTWYCTSNYVGGGGGNFTWDSNITQSVCDNYAYACGPSPWPATPSIPNCCSSLNGNPCGYNNTGTYNCAGTCVGASQPPASCVCNYSDMGSYHYSPQCCPGGSQRTGSLGGTTVNSCCPNVSKTQKFQCKSYDVTNSASVNYYQCYYVGECAANSNPDGSRTTCYV